MSSQGYGTLPFFSKKEEDMSGMLARAGLKRTCSRILLSLNSNPTQNSRDIERITNLRQPEVSIAIKYLLELGWVCAHDYIPDDGTRPIKKYQLSCPLDAILDSLKNENQNQCNSMIAVIEEIKQKASEK